MYPETHCATLSVVKPPVKRMHPGMPFMAQEIWHELADRDEKDGIIVTALPRQQAFNRERLDEMERVIGVVSQLRNIRNEKQIPVKTELPLSVRSANHDMSRRHEPVIRKLAHTGPLPLEIGSAHV